MDAISHAVDFYTTYYHHHHRHLDIHNVLSIPPRRSTSRADDEATINCKNTNGHHPASFAMSAPQLPPQPFTEETPALPHLPENSVYVDTDGSPNAKAYKSSNTSRVWHAVDTGKSLAQQHETNVERPSFYPLNNPTLTLEPRQGHHLSTGCMGLPSDGLPSQDASPILSSQNASPLLSGYQVQRGAKWIPNSDAHQTHSATEKADIFEVCQFQRASRRDRFVLQVLSLRHDGYLGALGALLLVAENLGKILFEPNVP